MLRELRAELRENGSDEPENSGLDAYLTRKEWKFESIAAQCLGLRLTCDSERAHILPGQRFEIAAWLWNHGGVDIGTPDFRLNLPDGWEAEPATQSAPLDNSPATSKTASFMVTASTAADLAALWPKIDHLLYQPILGVERPRCFYYYQGDGLAA